MTRRYYSREDVQTHYGDDRPAVNVKVYKTLTDGYRDFQRYETDIDAGFTVEWIYKHLSDEHLDGLFWHVCEFEFEQVETDAEEVFKQHHVSVERDGRSGGWAVVTGLPPIEEWDAILVARWRRFERLAQGIAADVMYQVVAGIYLNEFEAWKDERSELLGADAFSPETQTEA